MLISVFNAVLIVLVTWLAYRYFELRERTSPTEERYSQFVSGVASIAAVSSYVAQHYRLEGSLPCFTEEWKLYRRLP